MADQGQGALVHEMLGRFIEEAVSKAVETRLANIKNLAENQIAEVINEGALKLAKAIEGTTNDINARVHQMVEQGIRNMNADTERLMERTTQRINELSQKMLDDMPVTLQETCMQMTQENEIMFQRRAAEWMSQYRAEQSADMNQVLHAQFEALRRSMLEEIAQSAKGICDRNLFDFRSEFENHVNRSFQGIADRLTAPMPDFSQSSSPLLTQ